MLNLAIQSLCWRYENQELADIDLIANLTLSICDECDLAVPNPTLQIVLSEVITNAIDHGVLGLDSKIKDSENGFAVYLRERSRRIQSLDHGWVSVTVDKLDNSNLQIVVQDSGSGFDINGVYPLMDSPLQMGFYGRGLLIVKNMCVAMNHVGDGNCIVVEVEVSGASAAAIAA